MFGSINACSRQLHESISVQAVMETGQNQQAG